MTASAANNAVLVTGSTSLLSVGSALNVGDAGSGSQLTIANRGTVTAASVLLGNQASSISNRVTVDGGALRVTTASGDGSLQIHAGTNVLNAGVIEADQFYLTGPASSFQFNGGTLITRGGTINQGERLWWAPMPGPPPGPFRCRL